MDNIRVSRFTRNDWLAKGTFAEKALARFQAPDTKSRQYRAPDPLTRFLQTL